MQKTQEIPPKMRAYSGKVCIYRDLMQDPGMGILSKSMHHVIGVRFFVQISLNGLNPGTDLKCIQEYFNKVCDYRP